MKNANSSSGTNGQHGLNADKFWTLSGTKPFFNVIIANSHLQPTYQLKLPAKIQPALPSRAVPAVLTYRGKEWNMMYYGIAKRFDFNWRKFTDDNSLKIGDGCVFELEQCTSTKLVFRVQILKGDIPPELAQKIPGASANYPINIIEYRVLLALKLPSMY